MKNKLLYGAYLIISVLIFSEIFLRFTGHQPGFIKLYDGFKQVDSLEVYNTYITDSDGIYKFNPKISATYNRYYSLKSEEIDKKKLNEQFQWWAEDIQTTYKAFEHIRQQIENDVEPFSAFSKNENNEWWNTEFPNTLRELYKKKHTDDLWSELCKSYLNNPYNSESFRSIKFDTTTSNRTKVLLIGDSFVYGMSSKPNFNSFSDILLSRGYIVFNTGISGTDPSQYAAVSEKYIPLLKPDIVVLNFFAGNDLMFFKREVQNGKPHEHLTNAGFIESMPLGEYLSPIESYNFYMELIRIPNIQSNIFNYICSKSTTLSILWGGLFEIGLTDHALLKKYNELKNQDIKTKSKITKPYIDYIQEICSQNNAILIQAIIPEENLIEDYTSLKVTRLDNQTLNYLFGEEYYYPIDLLKSKNYVNGHFNNEGSLIYANYLDSIIKIKTLHKTINAQN